MVAIFSAGIGSGLQLEKIIEVTLNAERIPVETRLNSKEERLRVELSGVGSFKSALSSFQTVADKLKSTDAFYKQSVTAGSSDFSATSNGSATDGNFDIEVVQLADSTRIKTADFTSSTDTVGTGTLTFSSANGDTFNVAIDAADDLSAIRDKINSASDNFGVNTTLVNYDGGTFLSYSSAKTGLDNALTVTSGDAALANLSTNATEDRAAKNGIIKIDGSQVSSSTNTFKNNIEDITIVAEKVSAAGASSLTIAQDTSEASKLIDDFIAGYNSLVDSMVGLGAPKLGRLAFDGGLRSMRGQLNSILSSPVPGLSGQFDALSSIGISVNKDGKLESSSISRGAGLDSDATRLSNALKDNIEQVGSLFASDDGVVSQLTSLIKEYNGSDGSLAKRELQLNADIKSIAKDRDDLQDLLSSTEDSLRARFGYLDKIIAGYNATNDFLKTKFSNQTAAKK